MSDQANALLVTNLESNQSFIFRFFPTEIETSRRANFEPQDVTTGVMPLFYANREGRRLAFPTLWLDNSVTGESLTPEIQELFALQNETIEGKPPTLSVAWGDREEQVVLEEISVTENAFLSNGTPIRARLSLSFIEMQTEERSPEQPSLVRRNEESHFTF